MRLNEFLPAFPRRARRLGPGLLVLALALPLALAVFLMPTAPPAAWAQDAAPIDYDTDDDLLIEVATLAQLNAIRYDLDADGVADLPFKGNRRGSKNDDSGDPPAPGDRLYLTAFPNPQERMGCPGTCEGYELSFDLTFNTNRDNVIDIQDGELSWNKGAGWTPIGTTEAPFTGKFNGNDKNIDSLFINNSDLRELGLFGVITGEIRQLGLTGVNVSGAGADRYIGGLVGYNNRGEINQSDAAGKVTGSGNSPIVGGLVGENNRGTIATSYANVAVSSPGYKSRIGGLVGENNRGTIRASYAQGNVSVTHQPSGAGGLVGYNNRGTIATSSASGDVSGARAGEIIRVGGLIGHSSYGTITESYATGAVSGNGRLVVAGGLVASANWAVIRACYASGAVAAVGSDHASVGGLVGSVLGGDPLGGRIEASYSRGAVSHDAPEARFPGPGGLIGIFFGGEVINSYWDTETSGQSVSGAGTGKTTGELITPLAYEGIYAGWNLDLDSDGVADNPWLFGGHDSDYPDLRDAYPQP